MLQKLYFNKLLTSQIGGSTDPSQQFSASFKTVNSRQVQACHTS